MEGFVVTKYQERWNDAVLELAQWVREGKLKVKETVLKRLEATPQAFIDLFNGKNTGKIAEQKCRKNVMRVSPGKPG